MISKGTGNSIYNDPHVRVWCWSVCGGVRVSEDECVYERVRVNEGVRTSEGVCECAYKTDTGVENLKRRQCRLYPLRLTQSWTSPPLSVPREM